MSAVLKAEKMRRNDAIRAMLSDRDSVGNLLETIEARAGKLAHLDSVMQRIGHPARHTDEDSVRSPEFYDSLVQKYGIASYYVVRNPRRCGPLYDSLQEKHGDLSYYVTLYRSTLVSAPADSPVFRDKEAAAKLSPELIQNCKAVDSLSCELDPKRFTDSLVVQLLSPGDVDSTLAPREWWTTFYGRYPLSNGVTSISRVAFDKAMTTAVVRIQTISGPRAGAAWYSLLEKRDGRWTVVAE